MLTSLSHINPASRKDPVLLSRAGNSHAELSLVTNSLHEFAFDLGLIFKSAHVVLHGCLFLKVFSLPFRVLLFFHWKKKPLWGLSLCLSTYKCDRGDKNTLLFFPPGGRLTLCLYYGIYLWRQPYYRLKTCFILHKNK